MAIFYDDFERANGSLGGNWTTDVGSMSITGGFVTAGASSGAAYDSTITDAGKHKATCVLGFVSSSSGNAGPIIKFDPTDNTGYSAYIGFSSPTYTFYLTKGNWGRGTTLASVDLGTSIPFQWTITIEYDGGDITATCLGQELTATDVAYAGGEYVALYGLNAATRIADIQFVTGNVPTLAVSPDVIGNYGSTTELTFSGGNTSWSSGTPGTPTFTVDHGTLSDQEVVDTDTATATYDPGTYLGAVIFTDPSTGATATAIVTSNPNTVPPAGQWLSQDAVDYIERSAAAETNAYILNRTTDITVTSDETSAMFGMYQTKRSVTETDYAPGGDPAATKLLWLLFGALTGFDPLNTVFTAPTTTTSVKQDTEQALDLVANLTDQGTISLVDTLGQLGGNPLASHQDILTAIAGIEGGDLQPVLDAIAALRGDEVATVAGIVALVDELATVAGYTLADVRTWLETAQGSGLPTIADVRTDLAAIQPNPAYTLSTLNADIDSTKSVTDAIDASLTALRGVENLTLGEVMLAIEALTALVEALSTSEVPPVWPGIDAVTLGTPVALASQLTISEAMDGVRVEITGVDAGTAKYTYGGVEAYRNVGALCFVTDQGDLEEWQLLGRVAAIYTPKSMAHAAGVKLFTSHGLSGTITPWTVD